MGTAGSGQLNPRAQDRTGGDKMTPVEKTEEEKRQERRDVERGR